MAVLALLAGLCIPVMHWSRRDALVAPDDALRLPGDDDSNGLLTVVERNSEVASTYSYGFNGTNGFATMSIVERVENVNETLEMSADYQTGNLAVVNVTGRIMVAFLAELKL